MIDAVFVFGAKYLIIVPVVIAGIFFMKLTPEAKKKMALLTVISLPVIYIVAKIGSLVYFNPRPFVVEDFTPLIYHIADNGFPSEHTLLASALAAVIFLFNKRLGVVLWIVAGLIAVSRVYVGVHHAADVLGSVVISVGVIFLIWHYIVKIFSRGPNV